MARATRSSNKLDENPKENGSTTLASKPSPGKATGKKRKRVSNAGFDDQPIAKQPRNDDDDVDVKLEDHDGIHEREHEPDVLGVGDVPLDPHDAERILVILEKCVAPVVFDDIALNTALSESTLRACSTASFP
jgi:hypothetical protein